MNAMLCLAPFDKPSPVKLAPYDVRPFGLAKDVRPDDFFSALERPDLQVVLEDVSYQRGDTRFDNLPPGREGPDKPPQFVDAGLYVHLLRNPKRPVGGFYLRKCSLCIYLNRSTFHASKTYIDFNEGEAVPYKTYLDTAATAWPTVLDAPIPGSRRVRCLRALDDEEMMYV